MKTKHILSAALLGLGCIMVDGAAAQSFEKGTVAINAGIGLGGYRYSYISAYNSNYSVSPTINASAELGVGELGPGQMGIGAFFGTKSVTYRHSSQIGNSVYNYDRKWSNTVFGMRGIWHYNEWHGNDRVDLYAGLMLGYNIGGYKDKSTRTVNGTTTEWNEGVRYNVDFFTYSTFIGGRYLFTDNLGAYLELGYGVSYLNLGATLRF